MDRKYGKIKAAKKKFSDDEPLFVLRAQDALAPIVIRLYATLAHELGKRMNKERVQEHGDSALVSALDMENWQRQNPGRVKLPD